MGNVVVTALEPATAVQQWDALEPLIDMGYAVGGELMPEDMLVRIEDGKVLIWVGMDDETAKIHVAATTELVRMRIGLVCWIGQCGGDRMRDWLAEGIGKIEEYAKAEGCVKTVLKGRFGWEGVLTGYRMRTVTLEKAL